MKIVAIVAEYNPFHYGHLYLVEKIREHFGEDTAIVAIMSGNFTQRGELALFNKIERAKCALACGVNLILELPFPFSMSSAEYFSRSAIHIADSLGVVDALAFGSECGNLNDLLRVNERCSSAEFLSLRSKLIQTEKDLGFATIHEKTYRTLYNDRAFTFSPNNILGLMYLQALEAFGSTIEPFTIRRIGNGYNDIQLTHKFASASAIREGLVQNNENVLDFCPPPTRCALTNAKVQGEMLLNATPLDTAVISHLLLNASSPLDIHEGEDGLYKRLLNNAKKANTISGLIALSETKKYTKARIRRVIWNSLVGVTSSDVRTLPQYTQLLAADSLGLAILKKAKKTATIQILTKPSRYTLQNEALKRQVELSQKMDFFYYLALGGEHIASEAVTFTPFIKKG